ncbi:MAG: tRNA (adenosine(37)-N6)-threonylcarbamoyltransferase complex ATPase subunit type 1 TsaE [Christensenellales bacterium]|jgi:tRNA threonylcarbamoyladenosine biosynthesis protein TsaE
MKKQYSSACLNDTRILAEKLAARLKGVETITLTGQLGSGKTTFVQFLAAALGVEENITSPTFNIVRFYQGKFPLRHFDMYRLGEDELEELGFSEIMGEPGINVIEWNKAPLHGGVINISIEITGDESRLFSVEGIEL